MFPMWVDERNDKSRAQTRDRFIKTAFQPTKVMAGFLTTVVKAFVSMRGVKSELVSDPRFPMRLTRSNVSWTADAQIPHQRMRPESGQATEKYRQNEPKTVYDSLCNHR